MIISVFVGLIFSLFCVNHFKDAARELSIRVFNA